MIIKYYLGIVTRNNFNSLYILVLFDIWVDINDFSISFISEKETWFTTAGIHFKVRAIIRCTDSSLPVIVAEISRLRD